MPSLRVGDDRADGSLLDTPRAGEGASHTVLIPKGGTATYFVPVGEGLLENGAFYDARLCAPGTYDLQMTLGQSGDAKTNVARLTVEQPEGSDLAFWRAISATTGASGLNASMWLAAGGLVEKYAHSRYYHLLALNGVKVSAEGFSKHRSSWTVPVILAAQNAIRVELCRSGEDDQEDPGCDDRGRIAIAIYH